MRRSGLLCAAWLLWASAARAEEPQKLSPTLFWLGASASIVCASVGGFYALEVDDLYDEALLSAPVSPERARIHDEMARAEVTADVLLISSLVLAAGTTVLAFYVDWGGEGSAPRLKAAASGAGASFSLDPGARRPPPRAAARGSWW